MSATKFNVLHIDDDPSFTRLIGIMLNNHGIDTTAVHDPKIALEELIRGNHRVVLLDLDMPDVSGLQLLEDIKKYDGSICVIVLTGVTSMSSVLRTYRKGAAACHFKPITEIEPLVRSLRASFDNIERWWETLHELSSRRNHICKSSELSLPHDWAPLTAMEMPS